MRKNKIYKLLYILATIFACMFIIVLIIDYINYNPLITSFPFYTYILIRFIELLLPSLIMLIIGMCLKKKYNTK